jgi:hypothetical protein
MNPESPSAALAGLAAALEAMQVPWFVSGSLASSLHGIPRSTNDVDIVAQLPPAAAGELVARLGEGYYADEGMIRQAFSRGGSCNLIWLATMMKVDLSPPRFAFDREAMQRRQATVLTDGGPDGLPIFVCSPEDAILSKLFWYRQGREISQRQLRDIAGIIDARRQSLDRAYLQRWAAAAGVTDLLDRALAMQGDVP